MPRAKELMLRHQQAEFYRGLGLWAVKIHFHLPPSPYYRRGRPGSQLPIPSDFSFSRLIHSLPVPGPQIAGIMQSE